MDIFCVCKRSLCECVTTLERKYIYVLNIHAAATEIFISKRKELQKVYTNKTKSQMLRSVMGNNI